MDFIFFPAEIYIHISSSKLPCILLARKHYNEAFEGEWDIDFLLSHWHCILPAIAIIVGLVLMRGKRPDSSKDDDRRG